MGKHGKMKGEKVKKKVILTVLAILFSAVLLMLTVAGVIGLIALIVFGLSLCFDFVFSWKIAIGAFLVLAGAYLLVWTTKG